MKKFGFLAAALAAGFLAVGAQSASAAKLSRGQFCRVWTVVCNNTCPGGSDCGAVCSLRRTECLRNGCFRFNAAPGTRCDSSQADQDAAMGGGEIVRALKARGKL